MKFIFIFLLLFISGCATIRPYTGESSAYDDKDKNTEGVGVSVPW